MRSGYKESIISSCYGRLCWLRSIDDLLDELYVDLTVFAEGSSVADVGDEDH